LREERFSEMDIEMTQLALFDNNDGSLPVFPATRYSENTTETYKGIYGMHKYWGKKPFNVISAFIDKYSLEGDIVLDSFCGSGVTVAEALKLKRRAIGIDLNPIAIKLTMASVIRVDIEQAVKEFKAIKQELQSIINSLYEMECIECGSIATQTHIIWEGNIPTEVWFNCKHCAKSKIIKKGTEHDRDLSDNPKLKPLWFPTTQMFQNSRINVNEGQKVCDLFTNRAIVGLSYLKDRINKIKNPVIREVLELTFTGALSQASKLVFVIRRRNKNSKTGKEESNIAEVGSWVIGYWVPKEHFEINVWNCFENRFNRIIRGKKDVNKFFNNGVLFHQSFEELVKHSEGFMINTQSATKMELPDNSIDYVFIDPPHGNRILYMEMSLMWNAWLGLDKDCKWEEEIIISEAKKRNKGVKPYSEMMKDAISEIKRVIKPNKYFSLAFNSLDDDEWLSILNMCVGVGFNVDDVHPLEYSATSVVQDSRKNALKTDFVITFKKNSDTQHSEIVFNNDEALLSKNISTLLKSDLMETYDVINKLFISSIHKGFIFKPSKIIAVLNKDFTYYDGKWML